ncbi:MAG: acyl-CoA dehydrogenase family protein, partial [Acidimicrobiales bacterium]
MEDLLPGDDDSRRAAVRGWIASHPDPTPLQLAEAGWVAPHWPEPWGLGADPLHQLLIDDEFARAGIKRPSNQIGIGWAAPTIIHAGTEEQKKRYVLPALTGEEIWCQLFSEPGAGSDLASLATRAERDGDDWVVNGQKIWTTGAHYSRFGILIARTDPVAPKHRGITYFICPMDAPGIEVRTIRNIAGADSFNEVFFTDVRVPKENLLGEMNQGWALAGGSLAHERAMLWIDYAYDSARGVENLISLGAMPGPDGRPLRDDPAFRADVANHYVDSQALMLMGYRGFSKFLKGRSAPEHSLLKLFGSETIQKIMLSGTEALGVAAVDDAQMGPKVHRTGSWATSYLRSFAGTIPGGTSEIQ